MDSPTILRVLGYTICWEEAEILGSGTHEYGFAYPRTEEEALTLIKESSRNVLRRTVKQRGGDGAVSYATQWYDFDNGAWRNSNGDFV